MFEYYKCLARLAWRKYSEPRRLDLYEANLEKSAQIAGLLPQEVEYQLERPSKSKAQNIFLWGVNSKGQLLKISIKWRPKSANEGIISANFILQDDSGQQYGYSVCNKSVPIPDSESNPTDPSSSSSDLREFKAGALSVEVLSPFRRYRIKFRGYMTKLTGSTAPDTQSENNANNANNNQDQSRNRHISGEASPADNLVFIKIRFLWTPVSGPFDLSYDHDSGFLAQELSSHSGNRTDFESQLESYYENRYEQYGQTKGTLQIEAEPERVLYFWGGRSMTFVSVSPDYSHSDCSLDYSSRKFLRILGYNQKGLAFHIGLVHNRKTNSSYRYGHAFWGMRKCHPLRSLSISPDDIDTLFKEISQHGRNVQGKGLNGATIKNKSVPITYRAHDREYEATVFLNADRGGGMYDMEIKGHPGKALFVIENEDFTPEEVNADTTTDTSPAKKPKKLRDPDLTISFTNPEALQVELSGGKGASLAELLRLSEFDNGNSRNNFQTPAGVIVTTRAWDNFLQTFDLVAAEIDRLAETVCSDGASEEFIRQSCDTVVHSISSMELPIEVQASITHKLRSLFGGATGVESKFFAVRSSATTEDSSEMSAAGQMASFLGVKGHDAIYDAVLRCWASQFSYTAVQYKRGYGQLINSPMAVVIMEMIDCDSAGVLFTCDPLTGDERNILITGNYGLGESVVTAIAEPDTIQLEVSVSKSFIRYKDRSSVVKTGDLYYKVEGIKSKQLGTKQRAIRLNTRSEHGGTSQIYAAPQKEICCLSDEDSLRLGQVALSIQSHFDAGPRDIEWGIKDGIIYILQSRPITNLDSSYSDWELAHELDSGHQSEQELYSRANSGEVFPGSASFLALTFVLNSWAIPMFQLVRKWGSWDMQYFAPYIPMYGLIENQIFFNMKTAFFMAEDSSSILSKATMYALFGHELDDQSVRDDAAERIGKQTLMVKVRRLAYCLPRWIAAPFYLARVKREFEGFQVISDKDKDTLKSSDAILNHIMSKLKYCYDPVLVHGDCSWASSFYNLIVLSILASNDNGLTKKVFSDFGRLLSACSQVVSAEVPNAVHAISRTIVDKEHFLALSDEQALAWLSADKSASGIQFRKFLQEHGHRGYKEFDVFCLPWANDPLPLIRSLKSLIKNSSATSSSSQRDNKMIKSDEELLRTLQVNLRFLPKMVLRFWALNMCRKGVARREESKSFFVWTIGQFRDAFWHLSESMVREGRLPAKELLFMLTFEELHELVRRRNPTLVAKAKQRHRVFKSMNESKYDEVSRGPEMVPKNSAASRRRIQDLNSESDDRRRSIKGIPLCPGLVQARVCVARELSEAQDIQAGDILITYSTDIGWSPYFPLLSGLATEIGGLVSHGAVIAREYGLPCIIGAEGACDNFTTGEMAVLDSKQGIIYKIDQDPQVSS